MKRILLLSLIALIICSFTKADKLKWYSWDEGYKLAKKENKPVLVFLQASWCNTCKRMNDKTFADKEVISLVQENFIPVKLDIDTAMKWKGFYYIDEKDYTGMELLIKLFSGLQLGVPTTLIWTPGSDKKEKIAGLQTPEELKEILLANIKNE